jgi:hypothetical protein
MNRQKISLVTIVLLLLIVLCVVAMNSSRKREYLVYSESLDQVAVRVDDEPLTLRDLAFYVAYEEQKIEDEARIYNPDDTSEYWKKRIGNDFVRILAKDNAIDMAVHDKIFYELACDAGVELDDEEERELDNSLGDFWSDLDEEQQQALGITKEELKDTMQKAACAEKWERVLAELEGVDTADLEVGGTLYEELKTKYDIEINDDVWGRIFFGEITTSHKKSSR